MAKCLWELKRASRFSGCCSRRGPFHLDVDRRPASGGHPPTGLPHPEGLRPCSSVQDLNSGMDSRFAGDSGADHGHTYKAGDQIVLRFTIVNTSNNSVYVPREWEAKCPTSPHVWAWLADSDGKHFDSGYGCSCSRQPNSVTERMSKEAVLLQPNQHLDGTFRLDTSVFRGLAAGEYRIEARLTGWREQDFTGTEWIELTLNGRQFLQRRSAGLDPLGCRSPTYGGPME